jgi:lysyl-tRNA synthetase class 2
MPAQLAGRMTAFRGQGKTSFADLRDETGRIQVFLNGKNIGDDAYAQLGIWISAISSAYTAQ